MVGEGEDVPPPPPPPPPTVREEREERVEEEGRKAMKEETLEPEGEEAGGGSIIAKGDEGGLEQYPKLGGRGEGQAGTGGVGCSGLSNAPQRPPTQHSHHKVRFKRSLLQYHFTITLEADANKL